MTRPAKPPYQPQPGHRWAIRPTDEWTPDTGRRCRAGASRYRKACGQPAVAARPYWAYCARHLHELYGAWVENGRVCEWRQVGVENLPDDVVLRVGQAVILWNRGLDYNGMTIVDGNPVFTVTCDCATVTALKLEVETSSASVPSADSQFAFTCDGCMSTHWVTISRTTPEQP